MTAAILGEFGGDHDQIDPVSRGDRGQVRLQSAFADIITTGMLELQTAAQCGDHVMDPALARLVFAFDRRALARLRMLIDALNTLPGLPPLRIPDGAEVGSADPDRALAEIAGDDAIKVTGPGIHTPGPG